MILLLLLVTSQAREGKMIVVGDLEHWQTLWFRLVAFGLSNDHASLGTGLPGRQDEMVSR